MTDSTDFRLNGEHVATIEPIPSGYLARIAAHLEGNYRRDTREGAERAVIEHVAPFIERLAKGLPREDGLRLLTGLAAGLGVELRVGGTEKCSHVSCGRPAGYALLGSGGKFCETCMYWMMCVAPPTTKQVAGACSCWRRSGDIDAAGKAEHRAEEVASDEPAFARMNNDERRAYLAGAGRKAEHRECPKSGSGEHQPVRSDQRPEWHCHFCDGALPDPFPNKPADRFESSSMGECEPLAPVNEPPAYVGSPRCIPCEDGEHSKCEENEDEPCGCPEHCGHGPGGRNEPETCAVCRKEDESPAMPSIDQQIDARLRVIVQRVEDLYPPHGKYLTPARVRAALDDLARTEQQPSQRSA